MDETSTTIRERVAEAIEREHVDYKPTPADYLRMADAAIAIIVEVYRNGQASLIEEERKDE